VTGFFVGNGNLLNHAQPSLRKTGAMADRLWFFFYVEPLFYAI